MEIRNLIIASDDHDSHNNAMLSAQSVLTAPQGGLIGRKTVANSSSAVNEFYCLRALG